jgi:hypothetical protein
LLGELIDGGAVLWRLGEAARGRGALVAALLECQHTPLSAVEWFVGTGRWEAVCSVQTQAGDRPQHLTMLLKVVTGNWQLVYQHLAEQPALAVIPGLGRVPQTGRLEGGGATTAGPPNVILGRGRRSMALWSRRPPFHVSSRRGSWGRCILGRNRTTYLRTAYQFLAKHHQSWTSPSDRESRRQHPASACRTTLPTPKLTN